MKVRAVLLIVLLASVPVLAHEGEHHFNPNEKLGAVSFPTSCAPGVQKPFERAVALLHSFEYPVADEQFEQVLAQDPGCAIAYWGRALTLYHELWSRPTGADLEQGWEYLRKAQGLGARTARERAYIDALAVFYRDNGKAPYPQRASAYSAAMQKVSESYPDDHEAAVFYALSLLASADDNDATLAAPRKAVAILNRVLEQEPEHPGAVHYLIHACDNPQLAPQGLAAARRYAGIAPSSAHALHMPSHIFARLGLWQEDIRSNLASVAATRNPSGIHEGSHHRVHAMSFLEYAYLQTGDNSKAWSIVEDIKKEGDEDLDPGMGAYLNMQRAYLPALYALEARQWKEAAALQPVADAEPHTHAVTWWARAVGAGHLRDARAAAAAVKQYEATLRATRKGKQPYLAEFMATDHDEARAWLAFARGRNQEALRLLGGVADRQDAVGKGEVELPAREMMADMLLELNRPQEALAQYAKSLKTDPNRFNGLYGAARAAELSNQRQKASLYYAQLLKNCEAAGAAQRPELAHARTLVARN